MNKKQLNEAANAHAKIILGEEQFKNNKDAVKSITVDFKAGFEKAQELWQKKAEKWDACHKKLKLKL